jgi:hypothetical protein
MSLRDNKIEISVVLIVIGAFGLIFALFKGISDRNPHFFSKEINYEMPRPQSQLPPDFSLDGRDVDYDYNNPFAKKKAADAKKAAEIKKTEDKKKSANKTAAKKKTADAKKPEVTVDIVEEDKTAMTETNYPTAQSGRPAGPFRQQQAARPPQDDKEKDNKRSADQWRSLLNAQPTRENMDLLVAAYNKSEINSEGFYMVIEDLIKSQKSETQGVAVYGLNKTPSGKSFSVLALNFENLNADVSPAAQTAMTGYSQASRIDALGQALSSSNSKVVYYSIQVLQQGLSGSGAVPSGRDLRSGQGNQNTTSRYARLIPIIQRLTQSQDMQVAGTASQILAQLGGGQNPNPGNNVQVAGQSGSGLSF